MQIAPKIECMPNKIVLYFKTRIQCHTTYCCFAFQTHYTTEKPSDQPQTFSGYLSEKQLISPVVGALSLQFRARHIRSHLNDKINEKPTQEKRKMHVGSDWSKHAHLPQGVYLISGYFKSALDEKQRRSPKLIVTLLGIKIQVGSWSNLAWHVLGGTTLPGQPYAVFVQVDNDRDRADQTRASKRGDWGNTRAVIDRP